MYFQLGDEAFASCRQVSHSVVTSRAPHSEEELGARPRGAGAQHGAADVRGLFPRAPGPASVQPSAAGARGQQEVKSVPSAHGVRSAADAGKPVSWRFSLSWWFPSPLTTPYCILKPVILPAPVFPSLSCSPSAAMSALLRITAACTQLPDQESRPQLRPHLCPLAPLLPCWPPPSPGCPCWFFLFSQFPLNLDFSSDTCTQSPLPSDFIQFHGFFK